MARCISHQPSTRSCLHNSPTRASPQDPRCLKLIPLPLEMAIRSARYTRTHSATPQDHPCHRSGLHLPVRSMHFPGRPAPPPHASLTHVQLNRPSRSTAHAPPLSRSAPQPPKLFSLFWNLFFWNLSRPPISDNSLCQRPTTNDCSAALRPSRHLRVLCGCPFDFARSSSLAARNQQCSI